MMGKDLPWGPAMEGAGKHRFLPSLPSLNSTHFADGSLKGQPSFQMGEKCKQQSNLILTRLSISNMVAFTAQVIFQDGSTRCRDKCCWKVAWAQQTAGTGTRAEGEPWGPRATSAPTSTPHSAIHLRDGRPLHSGQTLMSGGRQSRAVHN